MATASPRQRRERRLRANPLVAWLDRTAQRSRGRPRLTAAESGWSRYPKATPTTGAYPGLGPVAVGILPRHPIRDAEGKRGDSVRPLSAAREQLLGDCPAPNQAAAHRL